MRKAIGLVFLVAMMAILVFGAASVALAAPSTVACGHSQAGAHASSTGTGHASDNSVLKRCDLG